MSDSYPLAFHPGRSIIAVMFRGPGESVTSDRAARSGERRSPDCPVLSGRGARPAARVAPRRTVGLAAAAVLVMVTLPGCRAPQAAETPPALVVSVRDYDRYVDRVLSTLRRYDLPPERVDRGRGIVVSRPTTSGQWFEFWRIDAPGTYQLVESSLHTVRRRVTVRIDPLDDSARMAMTPAAAEGNAPRDGEAAAAALPAPDTAPEDAPATSAPAVMPLGGRFRVSVEVAKERYSAPERQVTTASGALGIYNERLPTTEGLRGARSRGAHWVPLGRDPLLEARLLAAVVDAPGVTAEDDEADETPPAEPS